MSNNGQQSAGQVPQLTPSSMQQLAYKFTALVSEAQRVGVQTPEGLDLLKKASKIKAIYETYNKQKQQAQQAFQVRNNPQSGSQSQALPQVQQQQPQPPQAQTQQQQPHQQQQQPQQSQQQPKQQSQQPQPQQPQQQQRPGSSVASNIKLLLTPQQRDAYDKLTQTFNESAKNIKGEYEFLKKNIEVLDTEIKNRQSEPMTVKQLEAKKNELLMKLTALNAQFQALPKKFQEDKKKFYIECAATNINLKKFLQATSQQQRANTSNAGASSPPPVQPSGSVGTPGNTVPAAADNANASASSQQRQQPQKRSNSGVSRSPTHVTPVNAAANQSNNTASRPVIFKQPNPSIPIPETIPPITTTSVSYRSNRPTITGGSAMNASSLTTPVMTKLPPYEVENDRVMSKRKLRELVKSVGIDDGDGETTIDGDVEELLLDLADDFITNVTSFACRLAKHRKSDNLDVRDIQLHLERNWNIRIPGYAADEIKSTKKWNPTPAYNQKLQGIVSAKAAKPTQAAAAASTIAQVPASDNGVAVSDSNKK
ncbi:HBR067Cp [Eremothecium sinecaudum]|uniref:TBP-associated factor 12 n=1 Tax=Eremothecium sinecaudum TaxID=45286 RepID=A0A109UWW3_9SACH|nr:HBR067Cp [Eremothecium sinecaudum]AMD18968.1 HBR067Cp [Eremothecium sinecaudum]